MNLINRNLNNHGLNHYKIGFKSDTVQSFIPGVMLPTQQVAEDIQSNTQPMQGDLPDLYYMPDRYKRPQTFADKVKKVDLMGLIHPWFEHPLMMLGMCGTLSLGIDAFDKSCNKEYEKSIVGKAAKFGDKIEESKLVQNNGVQKVLKGIKNFWQKIKNRAMKNDVINAMVTTPSEPEWQAPKEELKDFKYHIVTKFQRLAAKLGISSEESISAEEEKAIKQLKLKHLDLNAAEKDYLKNIYNVKDLSKLPELEAINRIQLKRLGKSEDEITRIMAGGADNQAVRFEIFKKTGLNKEEWERLMKDQTGSEIDLAHKAAHNIRDIKIVDGKVVLPGSFQPLANVESFASIDNRAASISNGAKTKTGRLMSQFVQKIHRGFTFGNQKLGVMFWVAPFLVGTVLNTIKADKEEKVGTAVSGLIGSVSWVFVFPLALRAIHAFGGIQYAGMGKEKVEEYKNRILEFNKNVNEGKFASWKDFRKAKNELKKQLRDLRKVKNQNLLTSVLRRISKSSKADLLKLETYKTGSRFGNFVRSLPNKLKDFVYAPGRMLIFLFVGVAFADKIINKITEKIFGKPYDDMKANEVEEAKKKQEEYTFTDLRARLLEIQDNKNKLSQDAPAEGDKLSSSKMNNSVVPRSMLELAAQAEQKIDSLAEEDIKKNDLREPVNIETGITADENIESVESSYLKENPLEEQLIGETSDMIPQQEVSEKDSSGQYAEVQMTDSFESSEPLNKIENSVEAQSLDNAEQNAVHNETNLPVAEVTEPIIVNQDDYTYIPSQNSNLNVKSAVVKPQNKYIPSQDSVFDDKNSLADVNKYIPAQNGIKITKTFDNSALNSAIRRADSAEKKALDVLSGKFGDM